MGDLVPAISSGGDSLKSFWSRKEGKTGMFFIVAILGIMGYAFVKLLPWLLWLASSTLTLIAELAVIGVLLYMIFDPKVRTLVFYIYKMIMRKLTGLIIELDPIAVVKTYLEKMQERYQVLVHQRDELGGTKSLVQREYEGNKDEIAKAVSMAKEAQKRSLSPEEINVYTQQIGELTEQNKKYQGYLMQLDQFCRFLEKAQTKAKATIDSTANTIHNKERERQIVRKTYSALSTAMSILSGSPNDKYMYDQAMESMEQDISMKLGSIDRFTRDIGGFIKTFDLQDAAMADKGQQLLDQLGKSELLALPEPSGAPLQLPASRVLTPSENAYLNQLSN